MSAIIEEPLRILKGHTDFVGDVAFSPDGQALASSSLDGTVRLWQVTEGSSYCILEGLTTADNFVITYFSHETLVLGSSTGDRLYHCLAVVSGGEAPGPCPPVAYWDNPGRSASPRRHHGALCPSVLR